VASERSGGVRRPLPLLFCCRPRLKMFRCTQRTQTGIKVSDSVVAMKGKLMAGMNAYIAAHNLRDDEGELFSGAMHWAANRIQYCAAAETCRLLLCNLSPTTPQPTNARSGRDGGGWRGRRRWQSSSNQEGPEAQAPLTSLSSLFHCELLQHVAERYTVADYLLFPPFPVLPVNQRIVTPVLTL